MFPKGTIYKTGREKSHGEIVIALSKTLRFLYHTLRGIGAGLVAFSVLGLLFSFGPIIAQEFFYDLKTIGIDLGKSPTNSANEVSDTSGDFNLEIAKANEILAVQNEAQSYGVNSYFSIVIPKIDAAANIVPNVDASDKAEYQEALLKGVAHARGTMFPSQGGTIFLFSHSTDLSVNVAKYNAVFFLLRKLEPADKIIIYFADKRYDYEVESKFITDPQDTSWLVNNREEERLVLQTCDPPGTSWNRLLVIAKPWKSS